MSWNSNLRKGTDLPTWDWLSFQPDALSYPGTSISYDNFRYLYFTSQTGTTTAGATGTTTLWKYDTWSDGWHRIHQLAVATGNGADLRYDPVRNVLHILNGGGTTTWQIVSLNTSSVLANGNTAILGTTYQPFASASAGPAVPATVAAGGNLSFVEDVTFGEPLATGTVASATSTTVFHDTLTNCLINAGHVGCAIRFTSGSNVGLRRTISAFSTTRGNPIVTDATGSANAYTVTVETPLNILTGMTVYGRGIGYGAEVASISGSTITLSVANVANVNTNLTFIQEWANITVSSSFTNIPQNSDAYVVEYPTGSVSTAYSTTTIYDATANWTTNIYRDADVLIISGSNVGVRRRIASNTASVLTLTAATAGSNRTGPLPAVPDATTVYKIVPSSDFLYHIPGNSSAGFYRIDVNQTSASSWTPLTAVTGAVVGGGQLFHGQKLAPFSIFCVRGGATSNIYRYDIGLQTWTLITPSLGSGNPYYGSSDTLNTGAHACGLFDYNRMALFYQGTTRIFALRLSDGYLEPLGTLPYAAPTAYDGNRMKNVTALDGTNWLYFQRAGGGEFYRYALEHLP